MARAATSPELALFRTAGQWSKIRAAIYSPTTIYTARVNQVFSTFDKLLEITYDGGSGTLADVQPDMMIFIGSTAGAWDKGIDRIRSIDSTKVYIGETSDLTPADNDYITIVDDFSLWAKPVYISSGVIYMDGGIAYSDQHSNYLPLVRMGPDRVKKKTGATVSITFDFSATVPGSSVSSRATTAPGSSSISGATTATPTVEWNSVGWKKVYHQITGANGKISFGVRKVFIWDATNEPEPVEIQSLRADTESGGWETQITLYNNASLSLVRDHAFIILFSEDYYGATAQEIGPVSGAENILFAGWIAGESIDWSSEGSSVTFQAYTAHHFLGKIPAWPDGVKFTTAAPANWAEIQNLTVDLGLLHHFLQWRTTAPKVIDIYGTDDSRYTKEVASLAVDLWSQIREMAFDQIYARALVNRMNQLYIEIHPQLTPAGSRTWPTVQTIEERDLENGIPLERVTMDEASIVDLSGVEVNSAGVASALFALSPGHSHSHYGSPIVQNRLLLSSQSQAQSLAGLYRAWINNPYPSIPLKLSANNRLIDIAPRQKCSISIASGDTIRGIAESLGLIPLSIETSFDPRIGFLQPEVTFEAETSEDTSTVGDVPGSGDVSRPPNISLPDLPDFDIVIPGTGGSGGDETDLRVLVHDTGAGLLYSANFGDASPTWISVNAGLTSGQYAGLDTIAITPSGGVYVARRGRTGVVTPFIAYAPSIGSTFTVFETVATIQAHFPAYAAFSGVCAIGVDPLSGAVAYVLTGGDAIGNNTAQIFIGSGTSFSAGVVIPFNVSARGSLSYGFGNWRLTGTLNNTNPRFLAISSGGGSIIRNVVTTETNGLTYHIPVSTTDESYMIRSDGLLHITDNGANAAEFTTVIGSNVNRPDPWDNYFACDPTGFYILGDWDSSGRRGKSSDQGATWAGIPSLPAGGPYAYGYAGGVGAASRWVAAKAIVRYSPDFGSTWQNKEGNITSIVPFPSINIVRVTGY